MLVPIRTSRLVLAGLASTGALECGYLTISKLFNHPIVNTFCISSSSHTITSNSPSCLDVLDGPFSIIPSTTIPLTSIAFIAYSTVAILALLQFRSNDNKKQDDIIGNTILFLSTAMATFSSYLMLILNAVIHGSCTYCMISAAISYALAIISWKDKVVPNATKAFIITSTSASLTVLSSAFLFYMTAIMGGTEMASASTSAVTQSLESKSAPVITTHSSPQAIELAKKLKDLNSKMYGAYWCSHCYNQKQELGQEAFYPNIPYIECDKEGFDSQYAMCKTNKVTYTNNIYKYLYLKLINMCVDSWVSHVGNRRRIFSRREVGRRT
jgi:uncharacterized membrane protein